MNELQLAHFNAARSRLRFHIREHRITLERLGFKTGPNNAPNDDALMTGLKAIDAELVALYDTTSPRATFVIETLVGNDWERLGTIDNGGPDECPETFDNHTAARLELADHLDAMAEAFMPYDAEEYRIREVI
jgi:hypothetical protein